jgi:hypothetical protein
LPRFAFSCFSFLAEKTLSDHDHPEDILTMIIPRTFIENTVTLTPQGWRAIVHTRKRESIFADAKEHFFDTEAEAREFLAGIFQAQPDRFCTATVLRVGDNLVITAPYAKLPKLLIADGILTLNGMTVGSTEDTRKLKRAVAEHPLGACLLAEPCLNCGRLPKLNLTRRTLTHRHSDCKLRYTTMPDELIPLPVQVAVWNRYLSKRRKPTKLEPMTRPHFMVLGTLREPTENDAAKKFKRYEVFSFDKI